MICPESGLISSVGAVPADGDAPIYAFDFTIGDVSSLGRAHSNAESGEGVIPSGTRYTEAKRGTGNLSLQR